MFVGKAYVDEFLKEAEKGHYYLLRNVIKKLASNFIGSPEKSVLLYYIYREQF